MLSEGVYFTIRENNKQGVSKKATPHQANCLENFCGPHSLKLLFS